MSSIKEAATAAVDNVFRRGILLDTHRNALISEIMQALSDERERCAKIVNDARGEGHVDLRSLVSRIQTDD